MGFFSRDNEPSTAASPTPPAPSDRSTPRPAARVESRASDVTHIAKGSKVVGKITGAAELVIDGEVEGEIHLDSRVVIGPSGRLQGTVQGRSVQVGGKIVGDVRGSERVEVLASGSLDGDVSAPRVVIAEGAFFKGKVEMHDKAGASLAGAAAGAANSGGGAKPAGAGQRPGDKGARPNGNPPATAKPEAEKAAP